MEFQQYLRKPFIIEAIEITEDNLEELAKHIGRIRRRKDGTRYIVVDRNKVPNIEKAYVGFYMTKVGFNIRCFSPRAFKDQFAPYVKNMDDWFKFLDDMDPMTPVE